MFGEAHAHMVLDNVDFHAAIAKHDNGVVEQVVRDNLRTYQKMGVDFVRDGGDRFGVCNLAKKLGPEYGIDYRIPTFPIIKKGRYGGFLGRGFEDMAEFRQLIKEAGDQGADFLKFMVTGICDFKEYGVIMFTTYSDELITEMIHIAHEEGFAAMVHCNGAKAIQAAVKAGADSIEHGNYMDEETMDMFAESDCVWVPTISTYGNLVGTGDHPDEALVPLLEDGLRNVNYFYHKGGKLAVGSDAGAPRVPHGTGIYTEYGWLKMAVKNDPGLDQRLMEGDAIIRRKFKRQ